MIDKNNTKIILSMSEFFEYRKGSDKFGKIVNDIMFWLRNYIEDNNSQVVRVELASFLDQTGISKEDLMDYIKEQDKLNLASFNIEILDDFVIFNIQNNSNKMQWENKKGE